LIGPEGALTNTLDERRKAAEPFRDPTLRLRWTIALLVLSAIAALVALIFRGLEYRLLMHIAAGGAFATQEDLVAAANASDRRVELASGARAVLFILGALPFGMWTYRASNNLRALGAEGLSHSPGWAVGSNFVPIVNFFVPFMAMREIWQASAQPGNWQGQHRTPLLGWWWALWLGNAVSGWAGQIMLENPRGVGAAKAGSLVASAQNVILIALCIVAIVLLRRITANQLWQTRIEQAF
jgi:hypothetical protein